MSNNNNNIVRNRSIYGHVFRDVLIMLHGLGVPTKKVSIERVEDSPGLRVRWDVIVYDQLFFEEMTIEEIGSALVGLKMAKVLVKDSLKHNRLNVDAFDDAPSEHDIATAIAHSFDRDFAELIVPEAANRNNHSVQRQAASQTIPAERVKDPKRQEAGRRAAAKRWGAEPANA